MLCINCIHVYFCCLFGVLHPVWELFTHMEMSPLLVKGCSWHSCPWSSEGSLACHTYCDTGRPFIMVVSEGLWHSHLLLTFGSRVVTICFNDLGLSRLGFEQPTFCSRWMLWLCQLGGCIHVMFCITCNVIFFLTLIYKRKCTRNELKTQWNSLHLCDNILNL